MSNNIDFISSKFKEGKLNLSLMDLDALKKDYMRIVRGNFRVSKELRQAILEEIRRRDPNFRVHEDIER